MAGELVGHFAALDVRFSVTAAEPLASWFRWALAPLATPTPAPAEEVAFAVVRDGDGWAVRAGRARVGARVHAHQVIHRFVIELNRRIASSGRHVVLHAGVVARSEGAVLLVAPSGSGKSTMTATATRRGWGYGGDEHGAIRLADGLVDPVPKPLGLKYGSAPRFRDLAASQRALHPFLSEHLFLAPGDLPGPVMSGPRPVELVVAPRHDPGFTGVELRRLSPAAGLLLLRENSFNFGGQPRLAFRALAALVRQAPVLEVRYGDAPSAVEVLERHAA